MVMAVSHIVVANDQMVVAVDQIVVTMDQIVVAACMALSKAMTVGVCVAATETTV
jgi:hypothetical protein